MRSYNKEERMSVKLNEERLSVFLFVCSALGWPRWIKLAETFGTSAFPISLTKLIRNLQENVKKVAV